MLIIRYTDYYDDSIKVKHNIKRACSEINESMISSKYCQILYFLIQMIFKDILFYFTFFILTGKDGFLSKQGYKSKLDISYRQ